jgi:hypothetical protein
MVGVTTLTPPTKEQGATVQSEVATIKRELAKLDEIIVALQKGDHGKVNADAIARLTTIIDGDPDSDLLGLRQRVKSVEMAINVLQEDKKQTTSMLKGMMIGLGLTGVTGAGTFITMLMQLLGGKP